MIQGKALEILKTGANVFLTGEPGSGKTHTINEYVAYLRAHGVEPAITASTGIAATHIQGQTIHSWSGIGIRQTLSIYDLDQIASTEYIVRRIQKIQVLIIDEISMIDANTLDVVDQVCREIRHSEEAFGGIQVIVVGDFFQLPPVSRNARFAFESDVWKRLQPIVCYITEQHRQSDEQYLSVLAAIRKQTYKDEHHQYLRARLVDEEYAHHETTKITKLFSHNANVDHINLLELSKLPTVPNVFTMYSKGRESLVASLQKGCLSPERLELKVGAVVMCTKNNAQKGYVNGTLGTVVSFEPGSKYPIIQTKSGEQITIEPVDWSIEEDGKQKALITQIPLRLAWAITIHKSQGMSLDAAVMDLREVFEYGQGYVALSRVRSLSGLYILGWNPRVFEVHPQIRVQDAVFMQSSEAAEALFGDIPKKELGEMHERFILAAGGTVSVSKSKKGAKQKIDTLELTLMQVLQGKPIAKIAKERKLSPVTILGHLEKLVATKKLSYEDIEYLIDEKVRNGWPEIKRTFVVLDTSKLAPVHQHYRGKYTYDHIRMARMLIALDEDQ